MRIFFDHYRYKLDGLEKGEKQSEKLSRNKTKFITAKTNFDASNKRTNDLIQSIIEQCDKVMVNMTVRFSKEIQLKWYEEMRDIYQTTESLEEQMVEIAQSDNEVKFQRNLHKPSF